MSQDGYHEASKCPVVGYGKGQCNKCLPEPEHKSRYEVRKPEAKDTAEDSSD